MKPRSIILSVVALIMFFVTATNCNCEDRIVDCETFVEYCDVIDSILENCIKTCNACDTDLCAIRNGGCEQLCTYDGEVVECGCLPGFRLGNDSRTCHDIDECNDDLNPCPPNEDVFCINTVGSFQCARSMCSNQTGMTNYYRSENCCSIQSNECGLSGQIQNLLASSMNETSISEDARILGGQNAQASQWPWQAQITYDSFAHCGAIVISRNWLLGAAHCFSSYSFSRMFVYMGHIINAIYFRDTVERREQRRIRRVIFHEDYDNINNDVALIQLEESVEFNNYISPVCLPCGEVPRVGQKCWTTGFGTIDERRNDFPLFLQEVDVPIVDSDVCITSYRGSYSINSTTMVCAGYELGENDSCQGDSGGPLVCQRSESCGWFLSGITSFGIGCGRPGLYGVYANVLHFEEWIVRNVGRDELPECSRRYSECRGLTNVKNDCHSKLDYCTTFPYYMAENCALACCQLRTNEISNCFDTDGSEIFCQQQLSLDCVNPRFQKIINSHCKKTCNLC